MNKKKIFIPFALLGAFLLAGCSSTTIVAKPDGWDSQKIIDKDVKDNTLLKVYNAIKDLGDTNSNVLNTILHKISVTYYGEFSDIFKFGTVSFDKINKDEFNTFLNKGKCKETYVNFTKKYDGSKEVDLSDDEKFQVAHANVKNVCEQLLEESYKAIYTEITGGTYSTDNLFYEERYITNNLFKNMYINKDTLDKARLGTEYGSLNDGKELPLKRVGDKQTYEDYVRRNIRMFKDDEPSKETFGISNPVDSKIYGEYFTRKLIPDVFRTLLIQNYVKTQRESTLARTYARKINMISVPNGGTSYTGKINELFKNFVKTNILPGSTNKEVFPEKYNFEDIEIALRGNVGTGTGENKKYYDMLVAAGFETIKISSTDSTPVEWDYLASGEKTHVFKGTKLGDLVEKYMKVYDLTKATEGLGGHRGNFTVKIKSAVDETSYNDLTGTDAHLIEEGLTLKEREINKVSYTKSGWYLKSGTISELSSTYKDRLFNIEISRIIDNKNADNYTSGDYARYYKYGDGTKQHAFLTFQSLTTESDENLVIINDGTNYSIVEIEEAVSTSKLANNFDNSSSYLRTRGTGVEAINTYNKIKNDVTIESSKGDTYKKNANQFYLMLSNVIVSDQSLYDYLKGQFPDLFNN